MGEEGGGGRRDDGITSQTEEEEEEGGTCVLARSFPTFHAKARRGKEGRREKEFPCYTMLEGDESDKEIGEEARKKEEKSKKFCDQASLPSSLFEEGCIPPRDFSFPPPPPPPKGPVTAITIQHS